MVSVALTLQSSFADMRVDHAATEKPPSGIESGSATTKNSIRAGSLSNGFRYAIARTAAEEGRVVVSFTVDVGHLDAEGKLIQEPHVLEHVLLTNFSDSEGRKISWQELSSQLDEGDPKAIRGSTSESTTSYKFSIKNINLSDVLDFTRNIAYGSTLSEQIIVEQSRAVISEIVKKDASLPSRLVASRAFVAQGGEAASAKQRIQALKSIDPKAVQQFYNKWYRANLQTIYIAGDIDTDLVEHEIRRRFSDIPGDAPRPSDRSPMTSFAGGRVSYRTDINVSYATMLLDYQPSAKPTTSISRAGAADRLLIRGLLRSEFERRREQSRYPVAELYASANSGDWRARPSGLDVTFYAPIGYFSEASSEVLAMMHSIAFGQLFQADFDREKSWLLDRAVAAEGGQCGAADDIINGLMLASLEGKFGELNCDAEFTRSEIQAVTTESVRTEMARLLDLQRIGLVAVTRVGDKQVNITSLRKALARRPAAARRIDAGPESIFVELPSIISPVPRAIVPTLVDTGTKYQRIANFGDHLVYVHRDYVDGRKGKSEQFNLRVYGAGLRDMPLTHRYLGRDEAEYVRKSGFGGLRSDQLRRNLNASGLSFFVQFGADQSILEVSGSSDRLKDGLNLLYHLLKGPVFESSVRQEMIWRARSADLNGPDGNETILVNDVISQAFSLDLYPPDSLDKALKLNALAKDDLISEAWASIFGTGKLTVFAGGPVDERLLAEGLRKIFQSLPRTAPRRISPSDLKALKEGYHFVIKRGYGQGSRVVVLLPLPLSRPDNASGMQASLTSAFGGRSRFFFALRDDGAYTADTGIQIMQSQPDRLFLGISFDSDPSEVKGLVEAIWNEVASIQKDGFTADETKRITATKPVGANMNTNNIARIARRASGESLAVGPVTPATVEETLFAIRGARRGQMLVFELKP